jgi:hypothetical protein
MTIRRRHKKCEEIGRRVRQGCCLSQILWNLYSEYLTREALEGFGDFKLEGKVIRNLNYGDDLVLLAEEEAVL